MKSPAQRVSDMNTAFGNPQGTAADFLPLPNSQAGLEVVYNEDKWSRVEKQCRNIYDEYVELLAALRSRNLDEVRDALCDIMVFANGAFHFMGIDADADMNAVLDGVMTRFIKNEDDLEATINYHANRGVTKVYFEGEFPTMVMKSAEDQPDAPKGKFLKSASYRTAVFPPLPQPKEIAYERSIDPATPATA